MNLDKKYPNLKNILELTDIETYVTIYDINQCEGKNIEPLIVEALLKMPKEEISTLETLKLAVKWNQFDKVNKILHRATVKTYLKFLFFNFKLFLF